MAAFDALDIKYIISSLITKEVPRHLPENHPIHPEHNCGGCLESACVKK